MVADAETTPGLEGSGLGAPSHPSPSQCQEELSIQKIQNKRENCSQWNIQFVP